MELRQLQYFLIVAQEQSFSNAAKAGFISQQALSKSISALESELNVQLFYRTPQGVELTEFGYILLKKAYSITNSTNDILMEFQHMHNDQSFELKLGITAGVDDWLDLDRLLLFQERNSRYNICTVVTDDRDIEQSIISEEMEIGIMGARGSTSKLDFFCLMESTTLLAINKQNPLSKKTSISIDELKSERFIFSSADYYASNRMKTICNMAGFVPHVVHQSANNKYIVNLVAHNQGVFFFPKSSIKDFQHPDIRVIPIKDDPKVFSIHLAKRKEILLSTGAQLLFDHIMDVFKTSEKVV